MTIMLVGSVLRKLMGVSTGTEMDHVVHVADYFGLVDLCQVIEEKKQEDKQKMLKMEDSSLLLSSTGDVAEWVGYQLGVFVRDGSHGSRPAVSYTHLTLPTKA